MKPVELIERALRNSSKAGDRVVDLFGGSGSTMIACEKTGRDCSLMEMDPKYVDVIVKRWQDFTGRKAVHQETGKEFGL
jgi:DNA modification methylase